MAAAKPGVELALQNPRHYSGLELRALRRWLMRCLPELAEGATSLTVRFTSDREVRQLNRTWRRVDRNTDVLSFPGERTPDGYHLGDIVLSVPTARRQARRAGHSAAREYRELILHGVLHCLGYDHEQDDGTMNRLERRLRRNWIERAADER